MYNVVYKTGSVALFTELDSQLQPITNGGKTKQKRPKKGLDKQLRLAHDSII